MGYNVYYEGSVKFDKKLDDETYNLIMGLEGSRRMMFDIEKLESDGLAKREEVGYFGELFTGHKGMYGDELSRFISKYAWKSIDTPGSQPSYWCPWKVSADRMELVWNRNEKSYSGHEWLQYIVKMILNPRGYDTNGIINWFTEKCDYNNEWHTLIQGNSVRKYSGYNKKQTEPDIEGWYKEQDEIYEEVNQKWLRKLYSEKINFVRKSYIWKDGKMTDEYSLLFHVLVENDIVFAEYYRGDIDVNRYLYKNLRVVDGRLVHDDYLENGEINDQNVVFEAMSIVNDYMFKDSCKLH